MDFHAGEYVELLTGECGYISDVSSFLDITAELGMMLTISLISPESMKGTEIKVKVTHNESVYDRFAQIGCGRFPKAKVTCEPIKTINLAGVFLSATERVLARKIDELIKAVNKINKQLDKER